MIVAIGERSGFEWLFLTLHKGNDQIGSFQVYNHSSLVLHNCTELRPMMWFILVTFTFIKFIQAYPSLVLDDPR